MIEGAKLMIYRKVSLLILFGMVSLLAAQSTSALDMPLPQFSNPFYNSFAKNYLGTSSAGRGNTGVASLGDATTLLTNPAGALPDSMQAFVELSFKPPVDAFGYSTYARYSSPSPFSLVGFSGKLGNKLSAAVTYSQPKSLYLDDFSIFINQGEDMVQRFPTYYLYQFTANLGYHSGPWHWGVNLNNQLHFCDDNVFLKTYDRVRDYKYALRIQPGMIYDLGKVKLGLSAMPPTRSDWDLKYRVYDMIQPLWVNAGFKAKRKDVTLSMEAEFEQFSVLDDAFDDQFSLKTGLEKEHGNMVYRLGYMFSSNVFKGEIILPENTTASADTSFFWDDVPTNFTIKDGSQHILSLGLTHYLRDGAINLAILNSFSEDAPKTQVNLSLSLYLSSFRRKSFMYFDD